ncbi:MAG: CheY-like receiver [Fibrobacteres bacterium]|nr:CheY-like receiver [Fibrobacterota bacterium]
MSKRIVIVDDSIFLIKQLTAFLEVAMGYKVVGTGSDGNQGVALYREHKPDLITLDITMPNKDGMEALAEIMEEFPDASVMMISAIRGQEMTKCIKIGAKAYMEKPLLFNDEQFVRDFKASLAEVFDS